MVRSFFKSKSTSDPRDPIISYVIRILQEKNHINIRAVIADFSMPKKVIRESTGEGYVPEVTAVKNGQFRIFSVETKETIHQEETANRWRLFADCAKQNSAQFYVVFPPGLVIEVKNKLKAFQVEARLWQASSE